jgi:hypothetical protein
METSKLWYRVDRRRINFIKFIFEAYEGLAVVTTFKATTGLIRLAIAPGCEAIAREIMGDLSRSILIEPAAPEDTPRGYAPEDTPRGYAQRIRPEDTNR